MSAKFAVLLGLVVVDSANKAIRFKEGSTTSTVNIDVDDYFARGNDGPTDLLAAVKDAIESISGSNTYEVAIDFDTSAANPTATVTISRLTGSADFSILWGDDATTFDPGLLGFEREDSAHDANPKVSTLSPSCLWVATNVYEKLEPMPSHERAIERSRGGVVGAVERASFRDRLWGQQGIDARRFHEEYIDADPTRALSRFLLRHADGKRFEFHNGILWSGTLIGALTATAWRSDDSGGTRVGAYIFSNDFYPRRGDGFGARSKGAPLYAFEGVLMHHHEADVDEEPPAELMEGMALNLDASDDGSFDDDFDDPLTVWRDISGNSYDLDNDPTGDNIAADPVREEAIQNGLPGVRFGASGATTMATDAASDSLGVILADNTGVAPWTSYAVVKPNNIASSHASPFNDDQLWGHVNGSLAVSLRSDGGGVFKAVHGNFNTSTVVVDKAEVALDAETDAVVITTRRIDATHIGISINGGAEDVVETAAPLGGLTYGLVLGANEQNNTYFDGWFLQLVKYRAAHTAEEVAQNVAALMEKWGIT